MTVLQSVREYLQTYAPLADERINADFLPDDANSYSVDVAPGSEWIKRYTNNTGIKQFVFVLASRYSFGEEITQQVENISFYDDFAAWLETQTLEKNLPTLPEGCTPMKIEATTGGYVMVPGTDTARYQIQCRLTYLKG